MTLRLQCFSNLLKSVLDISVFTKLVNANLVLKKETPKNVKDIHAFLGLIGYFSRIFQQYYKTINLLLELLEKEHKQRWEEYHHQAFQNVKELFKDN